MQLRAELNQALEDLSQQRERAGGLEDTLRQSRHDSDRLRSLVDELSSKCAQLQVSLSSRNRLQLPQYLLSLPGQGGLEMGCLSSHRAMP